MAANDGRLSELLPLLRCPASGAPLERSSGGLRSTGDGPEYPVLSGVPILIASERSLFDPIDYRAEPPRPEGAQRIKAAIKQTIRSFLALPPTLSRNLVGDRNIGRFLGLMRARSGSPHRARVLVVGGATLGVGGEGLISAQDIDVIETDIGLTERVQIVCDGHDLPFADSVFDGVICQAVLEHVLDPQRVADEIWRVLAPEGVVYSEVPFMQQVHAGAFDFTRFTHLGHRRLWRRFDEIDSGADTGPGMALGWSILYFSRAITPRALSPAVQRLVSLMFFWLKYVDPRIAGRGAALDAASGTFFLGSRRETPVDDREIVNGYRGADGPRPRLRLSAESAQRPE